MQKNWEEFKELEELELLDCSNNASFIGSSSHLHGHQEKVDNFKHYYDHHPLRIERYETPFQLHASSNLLHKAKRMQNSSRSHNSAQWMVF